VVGGDRMVDRDQLAAVRKRPFDLHFDNHFGNVFHDIGATEQLTTQIHQFRHRAPIANQLHDLRADERNRFRVIQPKTAREAFLREIARLMQRQLVELVRCQMHEVTIYPSRNRRRPEAAETRDRF
jgi:hypothetical protein